MARVALVKVYEHASNNTIAQASQLSIFGFYSLTLSSGKVLALEELEGYQAKYQFVFCPVPGLANPPQVAKFSNDQAASDFLLFLAEQKGLNDVGVVVHYPGTYVAYKPGSISIIR